MNVLASFHSCTNCIHVQTLYMYINVPFCIYRNLYTYSILVLFAVIKNTALRGVKAVVVVLNQTQHSIYLIMFTIQLFVNLIWKLVVHTSVSPLVFRAVMTGLFGQVSHLSIHVSLRGNGLTNTAYAVFTPDVDKICAYSRHSRE